MKDIIVTIGGLGVGCLLLAAVLIVLTSGDTSPGLACPPQNLLDGAHFIVETSYPPTPEDTAWLEEANEFFTACDQTK